MIYYRNKLHNSLYCAIKYNDHLYARIFSVIKFILYMNLKNIYKAENYLNTQVISF